MARSSGGAIAISMVLLLLACGDGGGDDGPGGDSAAGEGGPLPSHIYEGTDPMENPANQAPIGTGPFEFVSYDPGSEVRMERFDGGSPASPSPGCW